MPRYQGKALVGALKSGRSAAIRVVPRSEIVPEASCFCFFWRFGHPSHAAAEPGKKSRMQPDAMNA